MKPSGPMIPFGGGPNGARNGGGMLRPFCGNAAATAATAAAADPSLPFSPGCKTIKKQKKLTTSYNI